jgi:hypothetical protein
MIPWTPPTMFDAGTLSAALRWGVREFESRVDERAVANQLWEFAREGPRLANTTKRRLVRSRP